MRTRSLKRSRQIREYGPKAEAFLEAHPWCEFPLGCDQPSTSVQHLRGRRGLRLLDERWWAASCHTHQAFAEDRTGEALACGWLVRIEGEPA
jgi:hypothetical protein